jgi:cytochrome c556
MRIDLLAATAVLALLTACKEQAGTEGNVTEPNTAAIAAPARTASLPATPPPSREAALKLMHDRHENMEKIGKAFKAAGRELKGASPDVAAIRSSAATMAGYAPKIRSWFPAGTGPDVGKTMAKAAIWEKPQDFTAKAHDFATSVQAFNVAAASGDITQLKASFGEVGKACKACHDPYRSEHKH